MHFLPDPFNDDSESPKPLKTQAGSCAEDIQHPKCKRLVSVGFWIVTSMTVLMAGFLFWVSTDKPLNGMGSLFSNASVSKPAIDDAQQKSLAQLHSLAAQHAKQQGLLMEAIKVLETNLSAIKNDQANYQARDAQLEQQYQALKTEVSLLKPPKLLPKPIAKPKEPLTPPMRISLLSIRSQGGTTWVSLAEGLAISPLLTLGDEWHGVTLVDADPITREAQLMINGTTRVVRL